MIIIDKALQQREAEGTPVRVAMVGAGYMGRAIARQIVRVVPGMELVAISNRHVDRARRVYAAAGVEDVQPVETVGELEVAIAERRPAVAQDAALLSRADGIDALIEATGTVEFAAAVVLEAIGHRKHVILLNAELDATLGAILKAYADEAGVIYTNADGDQPGVTMNLYRFVEGIGMRSVLCGNIKGLQDHYRNPTTQEAYARRWNQKPHMVTSYADGTKISFEQAVVANATGMRVARRGMIGPTVASGTSIDGAVDWYPQEDLLAGNGIVDYVVGASPGPGVFVLATYTDASNRDYLRLFKMGDGPLYCFYTPYHLCHLELHNSVARAVLFGDATVAPLDGPCVEVVTTAKIDLEAGCVLDGIGGYHAYGQCENSDAAGAEGLLPMGVSEGCCLKRDIAQDHVLTYDDVELPAGRLCDRLLREQATRFARAVTRAPR